MSRLSRDMRSWRAVYCLTQEVAARHMGVSLKTWQRWEREDFKPDVDHVRELRELLAQPPRGWIRSDETEISVRG